MAGEVYVVRGLELLPLHGFSRVEPSWMLGGHLPSVPKRNPLRNSEGVGKVNVTYSL